MPRRKKSRRKSRFMFTSKSACWVRLRKPILNKHTDRLRYELAHGINLEDWKWKQQFLLGTSEGFTCFDLETAMSRPSGFAKSFEGILFVDCYHCPWDSPAFRFAAKSTPKKDLPEYGYFFPNFAGACPAIRVAVQEKEELKKLSAEACIIDVATVESFDIQLMVAPFTPQRDWTREALVKATSRFYVAKPEKHGGRMDFGPCEPLGDEEVKRLVVLVHYNDWMRAEGSSFEHKAACLQEFGITINRPNVKKLIDQMKIVALKNGTPGTVAEGRSRFQENRIRIDAPRRSRPEIWKRRPE